LIFKGVTALKKLYFGDHHLSEDLDFSAVNAPLFPPDAQLPFLFTGMRVLPSIDAIYASP